MLDHLCTKLKRQWWSREERTPQVASHLWQTFIGFNRNLCRDKHTVFLHTRCTVESWSWAKWQWVYIYYVQLPSVWGFLGLFLSGCMNGFFSEWLLHSSSGDFLNKFSCLCSAPHNVPENIYNRLIFKFTNMKQGLSTDLVWWKAARVSYSG